MSGNKHLQIYGIPILLLLSACSGRPLDPKTVETAGEGFTTDLSDIAQPQIAPRVSSDMSDNVDFGFRDDYPPVAYIESEFLNSQMSYCSGALIAPRVVITARTCLRKGDLTSDSGNARKVTIWINCPDPIGNPDAPYTAQKLVFPKAQYLNINPTRGNLALILLNRNAPSHWVAATNDDDITKGLGTLWGFGLNETNTAIQRYLRFAFKKFVLLSAAECASHHQKVYGSQPSDDKICFHNDADVGDVHSCQGDTGGPWTVGSHKALLGIHNYGNYKAKYNGCSDLTNNVEVATSISKWTWWIDQMFAIHNMDGSFPPSRLTEFKEGENCYFYFTGSHSPPENNALVITNFNYNYLYLDTCVEKCRKNSKCKAWEWAPLPADITKKPYSGHCHHYTDLPTPTGEFPNWFCVTGWFG